MTLEDRVIDTKIKIDPQYLRVALPLIKNDRINRSAPAFGDLDQDGDFDLLIGSREGNIYYYENQGSETKWEFRLITDQFVPTNGLKNTVPLLMDFDQDGDLDLIVGSHGGKLHLFLNQGTTEQANFISETQYFGNIWLGKNASPSTADLDNDGFLDLLVGTFLGKLVQLRNDSSQFLVMRRDYRNIDVNIGSAPTFADLDNGGQLDLVVGSDEGTIFFFRNETPDLQGKWMPLPKYSKGLTFPRGTCPQVVDLDKDGDPDLITGTEDGPVLLYSNDAVVRDTDEAPLDNVFAE